MIVRIVSKLVYFTYLRDLLLSPIVVGCCCTTKIISSPADARHRPHLLKAGGIPGNKAGFCRSGRSDPHVTPWGFIVSFIFGGDDIYTLPSCIYDYIIYIYIYMHEYIYISKYTIIQDVNKINSQVV